MWRSVSVETHLLLVRDVFGPEGRLVEILSAEDQQLAVEVMAAAESTFILNPPEVCHSPDWCLVLSFLVVVLVVRTEGR